MPNYEPNYEPAVGICGGSSNAIVSSGHNSITDSSAAIIGSGSNMSAVLADVTSSAVVSVAPGSSAYVVTAAGDMPVSGSVAEGVTVSGDVNAVPKTSANGTETVSVNFISDASADAIELSSENISGSSYAVAVSPADLISGSPAVVAASPCENFLPGDQSRPAHSPGCREQETTTAQSLARNNMHPMPLFHPAWPFPPYRPSPWPNPFPHWYPRPLQGSFEGAY